MYDVIIIGAGPAGISAGLYTKRANKKTLIIYQDFANVRNATKIDNYYGFENGITGEELYQKGIKQAINLGIEMLKEEVLKISFSNNAFLIHTTNNQIQSKAVIIAVGNQKKQPNIEGLSNFEGKGVSYCAICDGFFYRNKNVAVIGSGTYAISEVNDLLNIVNNITILTNGDKAPDFRADNVNVISKPIKLVKGNNRVEEIEFDDNSSIKTDGIFIAQGVAGVTDLSKKLGLIVEKNSIVTNENMETNIPGIYACGDATGGLLQISKAVYEGTKAGLSAIKYLNNRIK